MLHHQATKTCLQHCQGAHIFANGQVSSCCIQPAFFGNIHKNTLREIYQSTDWTKARLGLFSCKKWPPGGTTICYQYREYPVLPESQRGYDSLVYMDIVFGFECNIRCKMCCQKECRAVTPPIRLDPEVVIRQVDHAPFQEIRVMGGEPLFIPNALRYIDYLISINKAPSVVTNGYYNNPQLLEKIANHFDKYVVSLNAATKETHEKINVGSKWDQVLSNVKKIQQIRTNTRRPKLVAHMTIIPDNLHEIPDFIKFSRDFGFDSYEFCHDLYMVPPYITSQLETVAVIRDKLNKIHESHPLINAGSIRVLGLIDSF